MVAALWGLLTGFYATHVLIRWAVRGAPPGLGTLTATGAVAAVWLYLPVHYRERLRLGPTRALRPVRAALLVVLAAVVVAEWATVARSLARGEALPLPPALAAFAFTFVFRHLLLELIAGPRPTSRPGSGCHP